MKQSLVFFGSSSFSLPCLEALIESSRFDVLAVVTQPDRPAGRHGTFLSTPVKELAAARCVPVFFPGDSNLLSIISNLNPDLGILIAYGEILKSALLRIPRFGFFNLHASLLPKYRGASPVQEALLRGDKETGMTLIRMNERLDAGDVLGSEVLSIDSTDTAVSLLSRLSERSASFLLSTLDRFFHDDILPVSQNDSQAIMCRKIRRNEGEVVWSDRTALEVVNMFRAYYSWPGIYTFWKGRRLKLRDISFFIGRESLVPGTVCVSDGRIAVSCREGFIYLNEVQLEGQKSMPISQFLHGHPDFLSTVLSSDISL